MPLPSGVEGVRRSAIAALAVVALSCSSDRGSPARTETDGATGGSSSGGSNAGGNPPGSGGVIAGGASGTGGSGTARASGSGPDASATDAGSGGIGGGTGGASSGTGGTTGTNSPYGLTARTPLTTCIIGTQPPATIDLTGCYADVTKQIPAPELVPYDVNSPLWSDGAYKRRFFGLPGTSTIDFTVTGAWVFPDGAILVKEFWLERIRGDASSRHIVETRFLVKRGTTLQGVSYQWNDAQTNATLTTGGNVDYSIQEPDGGITIHTHYFPPVKKCGDCHNATAGLVLGPRTVQMNRTFDYGGTIDNQLRAMDHIGLFTTGLPSSPDALPSMPNPLDAMAPLESRARAYFQGNCAHCHHPGGPTAMTMDLRYETPFSATNTCNATPRGGDLGVTGARIIYPGDPSLSVLYMRMSTRGTNQMPPLATYLVDTQATAVVESWITSLTGCP